MTGNCLTKINSLFPFTEKLKEYATNSKWQGRYALWDFVSASSEGVGQVLYEHGKNLVQNVRDIDTCSIHSLYSMATEMDVENVFDYELIYPPMLENIMDMLSTNRSYLLTTGYLLEDECLAAFYERYGSDEFIGETVLTLGDTPPITGLTFDGGPDQPTTALILENTGFGKYTKYTHYIPNDTYISGYMEGIIREHLIENTRYEDYTARTPYYTSGCVLVIPSISGSPYPSEAVELNTYRIAQQYIGFMDDIVSNPELTWSASTSAEIIEEATHILRNICIKTGYYREVLKDTAQRHAMIGSTRAIEKLMYEYILRGFTKQADWNYYISSGDVKSTQEAWDAEQLMPRITDVNSSFDVQVVEYWDGTEYMNLSAESPLVCSVVGTTMVSATSSIINISGDLITTTTTADVDVWGTGPFGHVVSGGNSRFWESPLIEEYQYFSEHTAEEVEYFYKNIGVSGTNLEDYSKVQARLWDMFAVSGYNHFGAYPELSATSLSPLHKKYIGQVSGDLPPANIKNQLYPTIAPQPFLWNLIEKVISIFPQLDPSILFTDQIESTFISGQTDISGNIIDSWKYTNQEYISYNTFYEDSTNLDFKNDTNPDIDRDGSFHPDVLSAYILDPSPENMAQYYTHIDPLFNISTSLPNVELQLSRYYNSTLALEKKPIYQYGWDHFDSHYMLWKNANDFDMTGQLWLRYKNQPLPFPLCGDDIDRILSGECTQNRQYQQLYTYGGLGISINHVANHCYDFGLNNNILWMLGVAKGDDDDEGNPIYTDRLIVLETDYVFSPEPIGEFQFSVDLSEGRRPQFVDSDMRNFVGQYEYGGSLIFVFVQESTETSITFVFYHYDKNKKQFNLVNQKNLIINNTYPIYKKHDYNFKENIFRLSVSEDVVSIAYEAENSSPEVTGFENSIVTIDILKAVLSDDPSDYIVQEWKNIQDPY